MKTYSTSQAAKLVGVSWDTLHRWMREKKIDIPDMRMAGGIQIRLWAEKDIRKVRKFKAEHYRKKPRKKNKKVEKNKRKKK